MPTWQAIIFGVLIAYTPAAVFIAFILWREGDFSSSPPRRYKPELSHQIACHTRGWHPKSGTLLNTSTMRPS
jgi:hypothetical protein